MVTIIKKGTPIEEIKKKISSASSKSGEDIRKYSGTLKSNIDPVEWQKKIRNEWE